MERKELIKSQGYNLAEIQLNLFREVNAYIKEKGITRTEFAKELGVTKGYVTQVLNGDFDFKLSKLVQLSLAIGKRPVIEFVPFNEDREMEEKLKRDAKMYNQHPKQQNNIPLSISEPDADEVNE